MNDDVSDKLASSDSTLDDSGKRQMMSVSDEIAENLFHSVNQQSTSRCAPQVEWLTTRYHAVGDHTTTEAVTAGRICRLISCQNELDSINMAGFAKLINCGRMNEIVPEQLRRSIAVEVESLLTLKASAVNVKVSVSLYMACKKYFSCW
jgi:hypothetical protein